MAYQWSLRYISVLQHCRGCHCDYIYTRYCCIQKFTNMSIYCSLKHESFLVARRIFEQKFSSLKVFKNGCISTSCLNSSLWVRVLIIMAIAICKKSLIFYTHHADSSMHALVSILEQRAIDILLQA